VRVANPDPYPPDFEQYLASIKQKIGAESDWQMTNMDVYGHFAANGDWMRNFGPVLQRVIDTGVSRLPLVGVTLFLTHDGLLLDKDSFI
jgi:hypothetical protein